MQINIYRKPNLNHSFVPSATRTCLSLYNDQRRNGQWSGQGFHDDRDSGTLPPAAPCCASPPTSDRTSRSTQHVGRRCQGGWPRVQCFMLGDLILLCLSRRHAEAVSVRAASIATANGFFIYPRQACRVHWRCRSHTARSGRVARRSQPRYLHGERFRHACSECTMARGNTSDCAARPSNFPRVDQTASSAALAVRSSMCPWIRHVCNNALPSSLVWSLT